jgi:hypothetical protein
MKIQPIGHAAPKQRAGSRTVRRYQQAIQVEKLTSGSAYDPIVKPVKDYVYGQSDPEVVKALLENIPLDLR